MKNFKVNIYIATTWTSPRQKTGTAMWLVEFIKKDNTPETRQGILTMEGTETEAVLTALTAAAGILNKECKIRVFMRNNGVLKAYKNRWIEKWKENDFQSSRGVGVKHAEKWKELLETLQKHKCEFDEGLGEWELYIKTEMAKNVDFTLNEGR